jgi:hypothetical protein
MMVSPENKPSINSFELTKFKYLRVADVCDAFCANSLVV